MRLTPVKPLRNSCGGKLAFAALKHGDLKSTASGNCVTAALPSNDGHALFLVIIFLACKCSERLVFPNGNQALGLEL